MKNHLVIVESPTKVRTIQKFLGKQYTVMASMGHVIDLPERSLGIDVDNNFTPEYTILTSKKKILKQLQVEASKSEKIFLAPDPDREGEAIAWHIANKIANKNCYRIMFNEITAKAIEKALENPGKINMNLVNAQQARRFLDRLVGYKVSPFLWKAVYRGLSAGRVQSVALRLICEREDEIRKFIPQEYWTITADFNHDNGNFQSELDKYKGKKLTIENQKQAEKILNDLESNIYIVDSIKQKERKRMPPPAYITSTLQQEASRKLGMSPKRTMMIAQQLYEGISIEKGEDAGLITYMRTDSARINEDFQKNTWGFIKSQFGEKYVGFPIKSKKQSKNKIQDAHEAIRPTSLDRIPEKIKKYLNKDQFRLYQLIWQRYISSQMAPAVYKDTNVTINNGDYSFKSVGQIQIFDGFLKIYNDKNDEKELPVLKEGEKLKLNKISSEQHFTKPPARYNEASLIKELEQRGIGRPSTYAQIISTLLDRNYVKNEDKKMIPTDIGEIVNRILVENFPLFMNIDFTSQMESKLDMIENGEEDWKKTLKDFYNPLAERLKELSGKEKEIKSSLQEKAEEKCPQCGNQLIYKWGKHGRFLACENYPSCKYTQPVPEELEANKTEEKCPLCGENLYIKQSKYGRFLACGNYPNCKHTSPLTLGIKCPEEGCGGELVEKQSKKGKVFYGCGNYPQCKFATWDKPIKQECPQCGHYFLLQKQNKKSKGHIYCLKCGYKDSSKS